MMIKGNEQGGNMELRIGGIYSLPNGRELIVLGKRENGRVSYKLSSRNGQYEISDDGRLICDGRLTAWDVSNLNDTGRSVGMERSTKLQEYIESTNDLGNAFAPS
jgi:hypothetical protein